MDMKAIQITFDEQLLAMLDSTPEVKKEGRSAVLRRAAAEYLERSRRRSIAAQYEKGYGSCAETGLGEEFSHWENQGQWPGN